MSGSIPELFLRQVATHPHTTALYIKQHGRYRSLTWHEVLLDVRRFVQLLDALGVGPGDRVAQFSGNRYEWLLLDVALQLLGAIHVPAHVPLSGPQVVAQTVNCGARWLLVAGDEQIRKLADSSPPLPADVAVLSYDPTTTRLRGKTVPVFSHLPVNRDRMDELEESLTSRVTPETVATILYTSGTTGEPKGVVLNQSNLVSNALGVSKAVGVRASDLRLNFLPMSHVFARTCDVYGWIVRGAQLALAESRETVVQDCRSVRPTIMSGVPYFYSRLRRRLAEMQVATEPGALRNLLGGRIRICCCGGAPLPDETYDYFQQQGVPLLQGYGLTEASPVVSASGLSTDRRGSVGKPIDGAQVRIAADGEILTRGPHVMVGYWRDQAATDAVIRDGWLHTGDLGRLDAEGYLFVTGRKKELIVTTTGKKTSPAMLEALLIEDSLIAQAMVVGDARDYLTALVVPESGSPEWRDADDAESLLQRRVDFRLANMASHEQVKRIVLVRPFRLEDGELTAKLSLRRDVIAAHFAEEIEGMYAAGGRRRSAEGER